MANLYLCKPGGTILGTMSGLDDNSVSLNKTVSIWELTFDVEKYINVNGKFEETSYYNFISERMELYLDSEDTKARFIISSEPSVTNDGVQEIKSVTASSIEYELQDKILRLFDINTGQKISQENLLQDDAGHNYNINPYTNLPIDYITVHRDYVSELTTLKEQVDDGYIEWNYMDTDEGTEETEMKHFVLQYGDNGVITAKDDTENLFPRYISNLLRTYPRLSNNVIFGIDHRTNSKTYGQEITITESYLMILDDKVQRSLKQFNYDGTYITDISEVVYFDLSDSISKLITFYETYENQLSMIDLALEKANAMGWTVGNIPDYIARKKYSFSVDGTNVYAFLTNDCANTMKVIFDFDRLNKKVNIIDVSSDDKEHDTGVFIGFENLANQINIETSSENGIKTKFRPKGANDLGITYVNFGDEEIVNLDYFMHRTDNDGEHQFVSDDIVNKYDNWISYRDKEEITISDIPEYEYIISSKEFKNIDRISKTYPSRREAYIDLTKRYNQLMLDIDQITELLPNDGCSIDYTTFPFDDLVTAWKAYNNALNALLQLYKEDYNVKIFNIDTLEAFDPAGNEVTSIKDTMYWLDFASYVYTIIPNVENALKIYVYTDSDGNFIEGKSYDEEHNWIYYEDEHGKGNPNYYGNAEMVTENKYDGYLYDMSLYGKSELEIKRRVWAEAAAQLYHDGFILEYGPDGQPTRYNTADDEGWERMQTEQSTLPIKAVIVGNYSYNPIEDGESASGTLTDTSTISISDSGISERFVFDNTNLDDPWSESLTDYSHGYDSFLYQEDEVIYTFDSSGEEPAGDITYGSFGFIRLSNLYEGGTFTIYYTATNIENRPIECSLSCIISAYPAAVLPGLPDKTVVLQPGESVTVSGTYTHNKVTEEGGIPTKFSEYTLLALFATPRIYNSDICSVKITNAAIRIKRQPAYLSNWNGVLTYQDGSTLSISGNEYDLTFTKKYYKSDDTSFTNKEDFITKMNQYLDYVSFETRYNSLTKAETKGVIQMASDELVKCDNLINNFKEFQETVDSKRKEISNQVKLDNWNFTPKEFGIIYNLISEADYANENILITNLDNIVSMIDTERELYEDASKKLFELSRPQYSFSVSLDNLLSIKEFLPLVSSIQLLNYIYLKLGIYDNAIVKVRIIGIQYNPMIRTSEIELSFSNMVYTFDGLSDLSKLFGDIAGSVGTSPSSNGNSGTSGTYGTNDAEIQISNNMLNALLANNGYNANTNMIISQSNSSVSQILSGAGYKIDGISLVNCIKTENYNGNNLDINNTNGSIFRLSDGKFNLADGNLVFDGKEISITGKVKAISLDLLGDSKINGKYINGTLTNVNYSINKNDVPVEVSNNYSPIIPSYAVYSNTYTNPYTKETLELKTEIAAGYISISQIVGRQLKKTVISPDGIRVISSDEIDSGQRSGYNYDINGGQDNPI